MTTHAHCHRWPTFAATTLLATSMACAQIAGIDQYDDKGSGGGASGGSGGSGGQGAAGGSAGAGGGQNIYTRIITITAPPSITTTTRPIYVPVAIDDDQFKAHWGPFIEVRDEDGTLPIDVEVNDATRGLFLWVRAMPNGGQDMALTLRYGQSNEGSPGDPVWDGMFGVWHMNDDFQDATGQLTTAVSNVLTVPDALFGAVASFEAGSSLRLGDSMSVPLGAENFSVSMWVRPKPSDNGRKVALFKGTNNNPRVAIENESGSWSFAFRNLGPAIEPIVPFANVPFDAWTHLVAVREIPDMHPIRTFANTMKRMYEGDGPAGVINGVTTVGSPENDSYIGEMDELRIRRYPMSDAEVAWEHHFGASQDAVTVTGDL